VQRLAVSVADAPVFVGATFSTPLVLSNDGSQIVYMGTTRPQAGVAPGVAALYLRPINQFQATRLNDTDGATSPFFSPDGKSIGFAADRKLKTMPLAAAPTALLTGDPSLGAGGGSWGADGLIVYGSPLFRAPAAGTARPPEDLHQTFGKSPQVLPGGAVLFTDVTPDQPRRVLVRLPDGSVKELARNAMNARYVAPGFLVYAEGPALMALRFDIKRFEVVGSPVKLIDDVLWSARGWSAFSVSNSGSLAYIPGPAGPSQNGRAAFWNRSDDRPRNRVGVSLAPVRPDRAVAGRFAVPDHRAGRPDAASARRRAGRRHAPLDGRRLRAPHAHRAHGLESHILCVDAGRTPRDLRQERRELVQRAKSISAHPRSRFARRAVSSSRRTCSTSRQMVMSSSGPAARQVTRRGRGRSGS